MVSKKPIQLNHPCIDLLLLVHFSSNHHQPNISNQLLHRNYTMHSKSSHNNKRSTGTSTCSDSGLTREQHEQERNVRQASPRTPTAAVVGPPTQLETYVLQNVVSIDGSVGVGKSTVLDTILSSEQLPYVLALCWRPRVLCSCVCGSVVGCVDLSMSSPSSNHLLALLQPSGACSNGRSL